MKTFLLCMVTCFMIMTSVSAQTMVLINGKKAYGARFIMPDESIQGIILYADENGKEEFLRVVKDNTLNINPIQLEEKTFSAGQRINSGSQPFITESEAYRFLANALCEKCHRETLDKKMVTLIFTKSNFGSKNLIQAYWLEKVQKWCINITCLSQGKYIFNIKRDSKLVYL
jgi:hypothetical protein